MLVDANSDDESNNTPDPLELTIGLTFSDWEEFKAWIHQYALGKGFNYKIRTSETIERIMRRAIYECTRSGSHVSQITSDPTKRRNTHSQRTQCSWKLKNF